MSEKGQEADPKGPELTPNQAKLITLLAQGLSTEQAANAIGVTSRQARRWRGLPQVKETLEALIRESFSSAAAFMSQNARAAAGVLFKLSEDEQVPAGNRITAAKSILELSISLRKHDELEARILEIEARLAKESL